MQRWDRDKIVAAIQRWEREVGEVPSCEDWETKKPHPHFILHRGEFPTRPTIHNHFGDWPKAIEAAGLTPRRVRGKGRRTDRTKRLRLESERERLKGALAKVEDETEGLEW
jgi:hypothetical protein